MRRSIKASIADIRVGSSRRLEIAIHGGNAARILGAARGASVRLRAALGGRS